MVPSNEALIHCFHCHAQAFGIPGAGENRPALRNRINLAFGITRRTEWRAIIEKSAEVPRTIPAILLDIPAQLSRLPLAAFDKGQVTMQACNFSEPHEHVIKEEPQPNAFAFTVFTHHIHAVVPITRANERQAMLSKTKTLHDCLHTMIVQTGLLFRPDGKIIIRVLIGVYRAALNEVDGFIQYTGVSGVQDVAGGSQRQPEEIVRTVCTYAPARRRMPPMLDITLLELMGCAQEEMLTHEPRLGVDERHHVLQLVAETEGAPRLVVSAAGPKTARERLVQEPAIGQDINGRVGCFHLHCAKRVIPVLPHLFERAARDGRSPETTHQFAGVIGISSCAEPEDDLALLPVGQIEGNLDSGTGIQSGPHLAGEAQPMHRGWIPKCAVAPDELSPVAA